MFDLFKNGDWIGIVFAILFIAFILYQNSKKKKHKNIIDYKKVKKFVGVYSFWRDYGYSWENMINYATILKQHHIHYIRIWLQNSHNYISWFYAWKITNGDKNTPPEKRIYDLSQWNDEYWNNLKRFIEYCGENDIVVNVNVFDDCHLRHSHDWAINPEYHNIQGIKNRDEWYKTDVGRQMAKLFIDKVAQELNHYPNVIFTLCNENYDYSDWHVEMTRYARGKLKFLDSGGSHIPSNVSHMYDLFTRHGITNHNAILRDVGGNNKLWSSDGARFGSDINEIGRCAEASCQKGKGYELYTPSGGNWDLIGMLKQLEVVSLKYNGF